MQDSIEATCKRLREEAEALEERLNVQLEDAFEKEVSRIQSALDDLSQSKDSPEKRLEALQKAEAEAGKKWL